MSATRSAERIFVRFSASLISGVATVSRVALITFFLGSAAAAFAQPGVYNIRAETVSHSVVRLLWDSTSVPNKIRVRYGLTAAYEAGPGGGIQAAANVSFVANDITVNVSGLAPSTLYNFCPQASSDGGTTWSECINFPVMTAPRQATHPEYPEAPPAFESAYPDTSGYTVRSVASNCSNLQTQMNAAAAAQTTQGSIIEIPAGTVCKGSYTLPSGADVKKFTATGVQTSTARITLANHGFADGQKVKLSGGMLPGTAGPDLFRQYRGVKLGEAYYIKRINADVFQLSAAPGGPALEFTTSSFIADPAADSFTVPSDKGRLVNGVAIQVKSDGALPGGLAPDTTYYVRNPSNSTTFQLSSTPGGAAIDITTAGSGTHYFADQGGGGSILAWPPVANWIIVRTATPDAQFVPDGVRVTPDWKSKMAVIKPPKRWDNTATPLALVHDSLVHHWRFVGIEFTHDDVATSEINTTIDPHGHLGFMWFWRDSGHIVLDRCYLHGLGYPNRIHRAIVGYDGENMAIVNSYWEKLDWWHPYRSGMTPAMAGPGALTISTGTYYTGPALRILNTPVTVTITGGAATGSGRVYFDLLGTLKVLLPTGMSAVCGFSPCSVETAANPEFPYNSDTDPRMAAAPIATLTLVNGALTAVVNAQEPSTGALEGAASFIAGTGPGPFLIENNYISATGIPIHFDDMGNGHYAPGRGYIIRRNHFTSPLSQIAGSPWSDGKKYGHRHQLEMKSGTHVLVEGNIFENSPGENTPVAVPLALMATEGGQITDVTISNNLFQTSAGGISVKGPIDNRRPGKALQRVHIFNNVFYRLNGFTYAVKPNFPNGNNGIQISMGYAMEDIRIEHNTVYDSRGTSPVFLLHGQDPIEGMSITNNVVWANTYLASSDSYGHNNLPSCQQFGKVAFDCYFRAGSGAPDYTFTGNIVIVGWEDAQGTQPRNADWMRAQLAGLDVQIYSISEAAGRAGWLFGEKDAQFTFQPQSKQSPSRRASEAASRGADSEALERAIGKIRAPGVREVRASSAVVSFAAPDKGRGCYVLYGTGTDVTMYSRTAVDRSDSLERRIELRDLTPGFRHQYVVMCEGAQEQPRGLFETLAQ